MRCRVVSREVSMVGVLSVCVAATIGRGRRPEQAQGRLAIGDQPGKIASVPVAFAVTCICIDTASAASMQPRTTMAATPMYQQLATHYRDAIACHTLQAGTRMP